MTYDTELFNVLRIIQQKTLARGHRENTILVRVKSCLEIGITITVLPYSTMSAVCVGHKLRR